MASEKKPEIYEDEEISRMYLLGDQLFRQGVELGMKSFDHLITISSAALGVLLTIKSELIGTIDFSVTENLLFIFSVICFVATIIASISRNYNSGYVLVFRGERFTFKCNALMDRHHEISRKRHLEAKEKEALHEAKRKQCSKYARNCFYLAIISLAILIVYTNIISIFSKS